MPPLSRPRGGDEVTLGRTRTPALPVQGEIFTVYQRAMGPVATLLWLNLRWAAHAGEPFDREAFLACFAGGQAPDLEGAFRTLQEHGLLEVDETGRYIVHEPAAGPVSAPVAAASEAPRPQLLKAVSPEAAEPAERPAVAREPQMRSPLSKRRRRAPMLKLVESPGEASEPENPDFKAVVQIYHKRIGMIGPTQYEKLRFWVEEQGMEGAVVALAIEETVQSAEVPRISYLEGILRNWYNDGIRTLADLQERRRASKVLSGGASERSEHEGSPNAAAYQSVSEEMVNRWKELYPDEYDR